MSASLSFIGSISAFLVNISIHTKEYKFLLLLQGLGILIKSIWNCSFGLSGCKIFKKKDDYYLLNFLYGKIWDVKYIEPNAWNEYTTNINLDCIIHYLITTHNLNCDSLKIMYRVN